MTRDANDDSNFTTVLQIEAGKQYQESCRSHSLRERHRLSRIERKTQVQSELWKSLNTHENVRYETIFTENVPVCESISEPGIVQVELDTFTRNKTLEEIDI